MPREHGNSGGFQQGNPDKHIGNKGDKSDNIRSAAERDRAENQGKKPETKGDSASPRAVEKDNQGKH